MFSLNTLILCYIMFFTVFNFAVFLMFYLFGFTYDRDLRKTEKRIVLPPISRFFFFFRGIQSSSRSRPTKLCGVCEIFAFAYFFIMEIVNVVIGIALNDLVLSCRVSVAAFLLMLIFVSIFTVRAKKKIKATALAEHQKNVEDYLTPKETIDINNEKIVDEFLKEPHEKPDEGFNRLNLFDENSLEEAADASEGMEVVNEIKQNIIQDDAQENAIVEEIFSTQVNIGDLPNRETADLGEGMKMLEELRNNPIDDEDIIQL